MEIWRITNCESSAIDLKCEILSVVAQEAAADRHDGSWENLWKIRRIANSAPCRRTPCSIP